MKKKQLQEVEARLAQAKTIAKSAEDDLLKTKVELEKLKDSNT